MIFHYPSSIPHPSPVLVFVDNFVRPKIASREPWTIKNLCWKYKTTTIISNNGELTTQFFYLAFVNIWTLEWSVKSLHLFTILPPETSNIITAILFQVLRETNGFITFSSDSQKGKRKPVYSPKKNRWVTVSATISSYHLRKWKPRDLHF